MLVELRLRGLGAIDDAVLELGPGFTAVTGETGAGKTMLLTGLALLLGDRADAALVRVGHARAEVEGRFRVDPTGAVAARVEECGGALDGDELLIARVIGADGRSRAFLGGRSVPVSTLSGLADSLVMVHGQADQRGLLKASAQRAALDQYAGAKAAAALAAYRSAFAELAEVRAELEEMTTRRRERTLEADGLRRGLADVDEVAPEPVEDIALAAEAQKLAHVEALRAAATSAHGAMSGSETDPVELRDVLTMLGAARHELESVRGHDSELDGLAARVAEASYLLADVAADLAAYVDLLDADPARLAAVQDRQSRLSTLTRRYAADVAGVLEWAEQARARLVTLDDDDGRIVELTQRREEILGRLSDTAGRLSAGRAGAAKRLRGAVGAELRGLAMPDADLRVVLSRRADIGGLNVDDSTVAFGPWGIDEVEFQLVPHAGAPARPLHRGASGGELSRVMLAVELVLGGGSVASFVFDEVDAGVGGRAATEVGRRLAELARTSQVLVVTHLPQVAAFADRHVVVAKAASGHVTSTEIDLVDGGARLRELSRMLGGLEDSALGHDHAQELLATAAAAKSSGDAESITTTGP